MQVQGWSKVVLLLFVALEWLHGEHASTKWLNLDLPSLYVGQLGLFFDGTHLHFIHLGVVTILAFLFVSDCDLLVAYNWCGMVNLIRILHLDVVLTLWQHQKWLIWFIRWLHAIMTCLSWENESIDSDSILWNILDILLLLLDQFLLCVILACSAPTLHGWWCLCVVVGICILSAWIKTWLAHALAFRVKWVALADLRWSMDPTLLLIRLHHQIVLVLHNVGTLWQSLIL